MAEMFPLDHSFPTPDEVLEADLDPVVREAAERAAKIAGDNIYRFFNALAQDPQVRVLVRPFEHLGRFWEHSVTGFGAEVFPLGEMTLEPAGSDTEATPVPSIWMAVGGDYLGPWLEVRPVKTEIVGSLKQAGLDGDLTVFLPTHIRVAGREVLWAPITGSPFVALADIEVIAVALGDEEVGSFTYWHRVSGDADPRSPLSGLLAVGADLLSLVGFSKSWQPGSTLASLEPTLYALAELLDALDEQAGRESRWRLALEAWQAKQALRGNPFGDHTEAELSRLLFGR